MIVHEIMMPITIDGVLDSVKCGMLGAHGKPDFMSKPLIHDSLYHVIITVLGKYYYLHLTDKAQSNAVHCLESQFLLEKK